MKKILLILSLLTALIMAADVTPAGAAHIPLYWDEGLLADADILQWQGSFAIFDGQYPDPSPPEQRHSFQVTSYNWAGWGIFRITGTYNYGGMSNFELRFWVKTPIDLTVEMADSSGSDGHLISTYGWDGTNTWQQIRIPVNAFSVNFSQLRAPFMITAPSATTFYIDGVIWQDPSASNGAMQFRSSNYNMATLADSPFRLDLDCVDLNFDPVTYILHVGPAGMTIDPWTGLIQWEPTAADLGSHTLSLEGWDGIGASASTLFNLNVVADITEEYLVLTDSGGLNLSLWQTWGTGTPTFNSGSITMTTTGYGGWGFFHIKEDRGYLRPLSLEFVVDSDVDLVIGMEDEDNGPGTVRLSDYGWDGQTGPQNISIPLVDFGRNLREVESPFQVTAEVSGTFTISDVRWTLPAAPNQNPFFVSAPVTSATVNAGYQYQPDVTDDGGPRLSYSLLTGPAGMILDPVTGRLIWLPLSGDEGPHNVSIEVMDRNGATAQQSFTLTVAPAPPTLQTFRFEGVVTALGLNPNHAPFVVGQPFSIEYTFDNTIADSSASSSNQVFENAVQSFIFDYDNGTYIGTASGLDIAVNNAGGTYTSIYSVSQGVGDDLSGFPPVAGTALGSLSFILSDTDQVSFGTQSVPTTIPFSQIEAKDMYLTFVLQDIEVIGILNTFEDITPGTQLGDVNQDGNVSSIDASQAARHVVNLISLSPQQIINGEVNGDGMITSLDASLIARYAVGLITQFPIESN